MQVEKEECNDEEGLFKILNTKFTLQYNETIKLLQFYNLVRWHNESMEEWMGSLRTTAMECIYKEVDRQLKEQFIHGLNDSAMITDIIREFTKSAENMMIHSEHFLPGQKELKLKEPRQKLFTACMR